MQYCSLQHQTLLLSPVISTTGCCFCFGSIPSFFLELFLHWSPGAYWAPTDLGSSSFSILSFCLFILFIYYFILFILCIYLHLYTYKYIYAHVFVHTHTHSNVASINDLFCPWNNNTSCPSKKSVYVAPSDMSSLCQASSIPWAMSNATGMLCGWPLAGTYPPTTWPGNQGKEILVMDQLKTIIGPIGIQPPDLKPFPLCHWECQEEPWWDGKVGFHDVTQTFYESHAGNTQVQLEVLGQHGGGTCLAKFCRHQLQDLE